MRYGVEGVSDACGLSIPGSGEVTDAEVDKFVDEFVTPRFPGGSRCGRRRGSWKGRRKTLVLEFLHPYGRKFDDRVREIAEEYRRRFRQEAVMRVSTAALMEFVGCCQEQVAKPFGVRRHPTDVSDTLDHRQYRRC